MTAALVAAALVGANPGPAAHIALLGIVVVIALAVFGIVRWRNKHEATDAEMPSPTHDATLDSPHSTDEQLRDRQLTAEPVRPNDTHQKDT